MRNDPQVTNEVMTAISHLFQAYAEHDLDAVMALHATDLGVAKGGHSGWLVGPEAIKDRLKEDLNIYRRFEDISWEASWHAVRTEGNVAWVMLAMTGRFEVAGQASVLPMHFSAVLEKRKTEWLIVMSHVSIQEENASSKHTSRILNFSETMAGGAPPTGPDASAPDAADKYSWESWLRGSSFS